MDSNCSFRNVFVLNSFSDAQISQVNFNHSLLNHILHVIKQSSSQNLQDICSNRQTMDIYYLHHFHPPRSLPNSIALNGPSPSSWEFASSLFWRIPCFSAHSFTQQIIEHVHLCQKLLQALETSNIPYLTHSGGVSSSL